MRPIVWLIQRDARAERVMYEGRPVLWQDAEMHVMIREYETRWVGLVMMHVYASGPLFFLLLVKFCISISQHSRFLLHSDQPSYHTEALSYFPRRLHYRPSLAQITPEA
jgi:hypothetical protein